MKSNYKLDIIIKKYIIKENEKRKLEEVQVADVYWITGLSGAGKTTIGHLWYSYLKEQFPNTVFLDGDTLRQVFGDDLGYTEVDRRKSAMRNARICNMLSEQGIHVVCCTISMFDEVREWNRQHIKKYHEVYVKVTMETLQKRDQKNLYTNSNLGKENNLVGVHIALEEPKKPDLILYNDGDKTPEEQIEIMKSHFTL